MPDAFIAFLTGLGFYALYCALLPKPARIAKALRRRREEEGRR